MTELSLFRWSEFQVNSGELYNNFKKGAWSFIDSAFLAKFGDKIRCHSPVENIAWSPNHDERGVDNFVKITCRNNQRFKASCVLVTCSIGVLKKHKDTLFTPKLPSSLTNAINATGFGPLAKIFLIWESGPWWPQNMRGFQLLWPNEFINCCDDVLNEEINEEVLKKRWVKSITGFDPVTGNPNALLGWLGGPEAVYVEKLPDKVIGEECAKILTKFTGVAVPQPSKVIVYVVNTF